MNDISGHKDGCGGGMGWGGGEWGEVGVGAWQQAKITHMQNTDLLSDSLEL